MNNFIYLKIKNVSMKRKQIIYIIAILYLILYFREKRNYFSKNKQPKISIFLPVYNKEEFLERSISSIQNQTFKNIEIVAVNDGSTDNSIKILKKLEKKDKRIKIFNNDRNHGPLYSRAMGILNSTGDYLMNLDSDDKLINNDCLKKLYKKARYFKTDFLQFLIKRIPLFENQTEYFDYLNKNQLNMEDYIITNKLVKRELYLKVFQIIKERIYGPKWIIHDDNLWNNLIKKNANSKAIVREYIYYYKRNLGSLNFKMGTILDLISMIHRLDSIQKFENKSDIFNFRRKLNSIMKLANNNANLAYISTEARNKLKHIIINFININYNYLNKNYVKELNYVINKISNKKYMILYNAKDVLNYYTIYKEILYYLQTQKKKFLFVNHKQLLKIINYIYQNDVLLGFNEVFCKNDSKEIIKLRRDSKFVVFVKNDFMLKKYNEYKNNRNFIIKKIENDIGKNLISL